MRKNAMFRGCTRPPMFMGVPYVPFILGAGCCLLLSMYFNLLYLLQFRGRVRNLKQHDGEWVFTPNSYRGHKPKP